MRVAISLRLENAHWSDASTYVVEAERLGVDCVWSHESWGHDAVTPLAFMAARTSRIRLGTGIDDAVVIKPLLDEMLAAGFFLDDSRYQSLLRPAGEG